MNRLSRTLYYFLISVVFSMSVKAQWPVALTTQYMDSFLSWNFYDQDDETIGYLRTVYMGMGERELMEWQYLVGEEAGQIRRKWRDNPNIWELNGNGFRFTAQTRWTGDLSEWQITGHNVRLSFRIKFPGLVEEWITQRSNVGEFYMYTATERDLRDWICEDDFGDQVPVHLKVFVMFLVIMNSIPW